MNQSKEMVKEFHLAFNHPVSSAPNAQNEKLRELRVVLIAEELTELCQALGVCLDIVAGGNAEPYVSVKAIEGFEVDLVETADALGDLEYVIQGANLVFGLPSEEVFEEIHNSNMSKLGEDGRPVYREDGKILKGPGYFKPDIEKFFNV